MGWISIFTSAPFLKLALMLLESWGEKKAQDAESRKIFIDLARFMRTQGIKNAQSRFESEAQIAAGEQVWEDREKLKKDEK